MTDNTLLHRQVHPSWVQLGRITSQVFRPTQKDQQRLSVYDGDLILPKAAWTHYTDKLKLDSTGVMSISVVECAAQELSPKADPTTFPEHVLIDFSGLAENRVKTKAKLLKAAAEARGWQYRA